MTETRREMALRHVMTGRKIVADQKARIERLRNKGEDTTSAGRLLAQYEQLLAIFENDLKRLTE